MNTTKKMYWQPLQEKFHLSSSNFIFHGISQSVKLRWKRKEGNSTEGVDFVNDLEMFDLQLIEVKQVAEPDRWKKGWSQ